MTPVSSKLRIAEVFASIQGEGIWVGTPSVFVRISGCNLRCRWCDTPYASWSPEGEVVTIEQVVAEALRHEIRHVVITGGEPMMFDGVVPLARALKESGSIITIETAGTVMHDLPCDLMSISPKLSNSTPDDEHWGPVHESRRINIPVLKALIERYPYQLKFVVDPDRGSDVEEIDAILNQLPEVDQARVLLMPEGRDPATLARRARMLVPLSLERGWRLSPRWQIDLFGDTRGT